MDVIKSLVLVFLYGWHCSAMPGRGKATDHKQMGSWSSMGMGCPFARKQPIRSCGNTVGHVYQTINGTCNNPVSEDIGSANSRLKRLLPPDYGDGLKDLRRAYDGTELPNARMISNKLQNTKKPDSSDKFTHMFVQFGQFITHDFVDTPKAMENGTKLECDCDSTHPECIKIMIPEDDPFLNDGPNCIAMIRSKQAPGTGCGTTPREHINTITSYVDGTTAYGSNDALFGMLRNYSSDAGMMNVQRAPNGNPSEDKLPMRAELTPDLKSTVDCPKHLNPLQECFASGEHRANENIGLSSSHAMIVREHNRIAREFKSINPSWSSERIFQETKRIISAISQVITYREFLPALVGNKIMREFSLNLLTSGYYYGYDASYDASISNAFTTAAFRYGHSMINDHLPFLNGEYEEVFPNVEMHKVLFQTDLVMDFNQNDAHVMRGLVDDVARNADNTFVEEVRSKMFLSSTKPGRDLYAINIQRGRDHGLPGYNKFRQFCGLQKALQFDDFKYQIDSKIVKKLKQIYTHVDDVDLIVGGLSETPLEGAAVGPTFACIIGYQFRDLRKGDRFWFENTDMFSEEQLQELRKASFSRLMCDNIVGMKTIQPNSMLLKSVPGNERVDCNNIPQINLNSWKENHHVVFDKDNMEWTRWFVKTNSDNVKFLSTLREHYHGHVCSGPLDFKEEAFVGKVSGKPQKRIRFLCPMGTIEDLNFPKFVEGCDWTKWFDRDSPSYHSGNDMEDLKSTRLENPDEICEHPVAIQARTTKGKLIKDKVTLHTYHKSRGLVCNSDEQPHGIECEDYKVRYLCQIDYYNQHKMKLRQEAAKTTTSWSQWLNLNKPSSYGEREMLYDALKRGYNVCRQPIQVEYRIANSPIGVGNQILKRINPLIGLICINADQERGSCFDYEVRYLCDYSLNRYNYV